MSRLKNAVVGQSGGPTTVINASLAGVISEYLSKENCGTIYGAVNGIKGMLRGDLTELNTTFNNIEAIELLKQTPSSYLGSCRYRLKTDNDEEIEQILSMFKEKDIGYFFYIGGNDSMDTVMRMSPICAEHGIKVIGVPKTIDNDLMGTDHSPGFGSCAKYISTVISQMAQDAGCYDIKNVLIVEIMGRNAGWLTCASALARSEKQTAPDLIYLPERPFDEERFLFDIRQKLLNQDTVIVAISEGIRFADGSYVAEDDSASKKDMFGHGQLGGAGKKLEYLVKKRLGIKVRSVELNIQQRCASHIASLTDVTEAFECGKKAVTVALEGQSGKMIAMKRKEADKYEIEFDALDIKNIANGEKIVPSEFISQSGNDITEAFIEYAKPLILGECNIKYKNGIPDYIIR